MEKPKLEKAKFEFHQEGNCLSDRDAYEFLEIQCVADIGIDNMETCFFVLKTKSWSVDSEEELKELFDRIRKTLFNK